MCTYMYIHTQRNFNKTIFTLISCDMLWYFNCFVFQKILSMTLETDCITHQWIMISSLKGISIEKNIWNSKFKNLGSRISLEKWLVLELSQEICKKSLWRTNEVQIKRTQKPICNELPLSTFIWYQKEAPTQNAGLP